jgi:hypothetical protein
VIRRLVARALALGALIAAVAIVWSIARAALG